MQEIGRIPAAGTKTDGNLNLAMKTSSYLLATVRQVHADVEIVSHRLMLKAGMIRQLASGIYSWLPTGLRVLNKVENIVREEMNAAGALEVLMPSVQPAEIWRESGRWDFFGPELLRFKDRHMRDFCLGPTHEEVITTLVNNEVRSYRQLPANFYQMQWKFRDEIRPRFGVMRCREFLMKDAYSFDKSFEGMQASYQVMYDAYSRIFDRFGLDFVAVEADSGAIGGAVSHEFHVLADSGEDAIGVNAEVGYAANVELIPITPEPAKQTDTAALLQIVDTPGVKTIAQLCDFLDVEPAATVKTLIVHGTEGPVALVVRGDHELNALKAQRLDAVESPLRFLSAAAVKELLAVDVGSLGPVNLKDRRASPIAVIADHATASMTEIICGANQPQRHCRDVKWVRDVPHLEFADLRKAVSGDRVPDHSSEALTIKRGIEVGHVFQLGTKYSEAFSANCLDEAGKSAIMWMGCYGIGVSRIVAAAIEQNHDDAGIIWPGAIAPFTVCIVPINMHRSAQVAQITSELYESLLASGIEVLLDDRDERAGVKFADMDMIGIPHRVVVSDRGIERKQLEYKFRAASESEDLPLVEALMQIKKRIHSA